MVSAVFDEWRGFGLPLTEAEVNPVSNTRQAAALDAGTVTEKSK